MNYAYQLTGIMKDNVRQFLYSDITCSNLNENSLSESSGIVQMDLSSFLFCLSLFHSLHLLIVLKEFNARLARQLTKHIFNLRMWTLLSIQLSTGIVTVESTHLQVDIIIISPFLLFRLLRLLSLLSSVLTFISIVRVDVNSDGLSGVLNGGVNEFNALNYRGGSIGTAHAKRSVEDEHRTSEKPKSEVYTLSIAFLV